MLFVVATAALVLVLGAAIAQAVREQSSAPLWSVAWLPAVVAAGGFYRKDATRPCRPRLRRQSPAESRVQAP
jgi:Mn2+/Fe2+ NRAMP family transporter